MFVCESVCVVYRMFVCLCVGGFEDPLVETKKECLTLTAPVIEYWALSHTKYYLQRSSICKNQSFGATNHFKYTNEQSVSLSNSLVRKLQGMISRYLAEHALLIRHSG